MTSAISSRSHLSRSSSQVSDMTRAYQARRAEDSINHTAAPYLLPLGRRRWYDRAASLVRKESGMWRMDSGDRALTDAEWAVFAVGLGALWDFVEDDVEEGVPGASETGARAFDELQREQKVALLADVALALRDPSAPAPDLTAASEGAVAAVFAVVRSELQDEIDAQEAGEGGHPIRSLVLAAQQPDVLEEGGMPAPGD